MACLVIGAVLFTFGRGSGSGAFKVTGVGVIAVFVLATVFSLATSRCPHCRRYIDLRGPSDYCPKCGGWIPAHEGDPPEIPR